MSMSSMKPFGNGEIISSSPSLMGTRIRWRFCTIQNLPFLSRSSSLAAVSLVMLRTSADLSTPPFLSYILT
jgi:hypothetical protein